MLKIIIKGKNNAVINLPFGTCPVRVYNDVVFNTFMLRTSSFGSLRYVDLVPKVLLFMGG